MQNVSLCASVSGDGFQKKNKFFSFFGRFIIKFRRHIDLSGFCYGKFTIVVAFLKEMWNR